MRKHYDFSKGIRNPYARRLKRSVTIRLDARTVEYFKSLAERKGIAYQSLINLYLRDCAERGVELAMEWKPSREGAACRVLQEFFTPPSPLPLAGAAGPEHGRRAGEVAASRSEEAGEGKSSHAPTARSPRAAKPVKISPHPPLDFARDTLSRRAGRGDRFGAVCVLRSFAESFPPLPPTRHPVLPSPLMPSTAQVNSNNSERTAPEAGRETSSGTSDPAAGRGVNAPPSSTAPAATTPDGNDRSKPDRAGDGGESLAAALPDETLFAWLRDMLLIREFEVRTMQAYQEKKIGGFCHVYIGQEAVAVGCTAAIEPRDPMVTAYRDHGHALARGMDPRHCMAEMFGRIGGCAKGKGGSMHMFDKANNLFGGHGIVGAQTPLGAGLAFATKYEDEVLNGGKSDRVTLCFLGDGALNQGAFHEAKNLAGLFHLPVIFIVENNGYSMGTAISRGTTMGHDIVSKAIGYGIDSAVIDGMDVMTVYDAMKPIVDRCRADSRPAFIDMRTYRYKGHSMSDPRKYRTREEEEQYELSDPLTRFAAWLEANRGYSKERYADLVKEIRQEVRDCVKWADESPEPPMEELYTDVYVERFGPYRGTSLPEMLRGDGDAT